MPRYVVEREFAAGLIVPINDDGAKACRNVVDTNLTDGVTWVHSYVSTDKKKSFCIYDGPNPKPSGAPPARPTCRSTRFPKSACSIPISINRAAPVLDIPSSMSRGGGPYGLPPPPSTAPEIPCAVRRRAWRNHRSGPRRRRASCRPRIHAVRCP